MKQSKNEEKLQKHIEYKNFLEKAIKSKNFKINDPIRYEESKKKLEKVKSLIKLLS